MDLDHAALERHKEVVMARVDARVLNFVLVSECVGVLSAVTVLVLDYL